MTLTRHPAPDTEPPLPATEAARAAAPVVRLLSLIRPQRALVMAMLVCGVASIGLVVAGPRILGHATDVLFAGLRAGAGADGRALARTLFVALAVYLASGLLWIVQGRLTTRIIQRTVAGLRARVEAKLGRLPLSYFDRSKRGEVLSLTTNDIDNFSQALQQSMSQIVNSLLLVAGVLAMMFWLSPPLALIALIVVPLSVYASRAIGKRAQPRFAHQWKATGELNSQVEEAYTGHAVVKAFGRHEELAAAFHEQNEELRRAAFRAQFLGALGQPAVVFLTNLNYVLIAVCGGILVASGSLSLGGAQAFIQYARQYNGPLTQVAALAAVVQSGLASAERVFALLDAPEQSPEPQLSPESTGRLGGAVAFESVSFQYEPGRPLIEDLTFTAERGQRIAIVGPTGAGKSTLVGLLMRFYEVTGGRVVLGGVDIASLPREELRARIGMVPQDTWLFHGTVAENIAYGAPRGASREQVEEAARTAYADHFIRTLPDGYDTLLDDEGGRISAGERQLITIARAFLSDPAVLVLDEATSSVDTRTEVLIQKAVARLSQGRTTFVIAHRLSTIRESDVIVVMEGGAIVEQGTHTELLATGGAYTRLHAAQFSRRTPAGSAHRVVE
ncbi:ABC transporter ATP-binding protein [Streptomyces sp. NPDC005408]|uniref:ABC transporter ATP-binding protein n=1 Tax=Streptomyces sp. NPDC005408 TaxID=3155341 RepID=UPI0033AEC907